jgi:TetR/AcrR family transcriptional repressor of nem operon
MFNVKRILEKKMRYPAAETAAKHERILEEASRLFRERGFSGVSVAEIMKATGLTHGPFYNHFASKEALMAESLAHASDQSLAGLGAAASQSPEAMKAYVQGYLSMAHVAAPGTGCLMASLGPEVSREAPVKPGFTAHLKRSIAGMAEHFPFGAKRHARRDAIRLLAAMVGAVVLARATDDSALAEEILREVRSAFE